MGKGLGQSPKLGGSVVCSCPNAELFCEAAVGAAPHNQDKLSRLPPHSLPCSCTAQPPTPHGAQGGLDSPGPPWKQLCGAVLSLVGDAELCPWVGAHILTLQRGTG